MVADNPDVDYIVRIPAGHAEQVLAFKDVVLALRQHITLICACTLAGLLLAGLFAFFTEPVYRAEVLLVPVEEDSSSGMDVGFRADTLAGRLRIGTSRCRQSIDVNLRAVEIKSIAVTVSRC